jgi:hypothetical protein
MWEKPRNSILVIPTGAASQILRHLDRSGEAAQWRDLLSASRATHTGAPHLEEMWEKAGTPTLLSVSDQRR